MIPRLDEIKKEQDSFCIVMLPDSQNYVDEAKNAECCWNSQIDWIFKNRDRLNIRFVTHVGDLVSDCFNEKQFQRAFFQLGRLNGAVPYGICPGNHDLTEDGSAPYWERYFPEEAGKLHSYWIGSYDKNKHNAQKIRVNGRDYLFVHLAYLPSDGAIAWAKEILEQNPDCYTILSTHSFLINDWTEHGIVRRESRVSLTDTRIHHDGTNAGEDIFRELVEKYDCVKMVLSGHYYGCYHEELKAKERTVHAIQANYEYAFPFGGNGFMRIIRFDFAENRICCYSYSPLLDAYKLGEHEMFELCMND